MEQLPNAINNGDGKTQEQSIEFNEWKIKAQELKQDIQELIDARINDFANQIEQDILNKKQKASDPFSAKSLPKSFENRPDLKREAEKQFFERESLLTELFHSTHIKTIYNFFLAVLVLLILNSFVHDLLDTGTLDLRYDLIRWCFGKFPIVISTWLCMFFSLVLLLYPGFNYWAHIQKRPGLLDSCFWITMYVTYTVAMFFCPIYFGVVKHELPVASSICIVCEQVRFIMKFHAFVRENTPRALRYKSAFDHRDDDVKRMEAVPCPRFEKFLYFLFAPTLVYRDEYPRSKSTNWSLVVGNFAEVLGCIFYTHYVFSRFCIPVFEKFNSDHITLRAFVLAAFSSILPGYLCLLLLFWGLLHAWLNMFAEMLRFADRLFYKDWWNSTSFSGYYRSWNVVVHDWLYAYVYKDLNTIFRSSSRGRAAITVFLMSAIIHEYIFIVGFKFFYPVMFLLFFGFGVSFFFITNKIKLQQAWNVFMWFNLMIGNGIIMALYSMEWYARKNCPPTFDNYLDYLVPRSWTCSSNSTAVP